MHSPQVHSPQVPPPLRGQDPGPGSCCSAARRGGRLLSARCGLRELPPAAGVTCSFGLFSRLLAARGEAAASRGAAPCGLCLTITVRSAGIACSGSTTRTPSPQLRRPRALLPRGNCCFQGGLIVCFTSDYRTRSCRGDQQLQPKMYQCSGFSTNKLSQSV